MQEEVFKTRGLFVTFEGIDGCGKTTQVKLLQRNLLNNKIPFVALREPGGTVVGEDIRQILLDRQKSISLQTELLLYMAARSELTGQVILPALFSGKVVCCDRFSDSTKAYQGYGGGCDLGLIDYLNRRATGGIKPDLTLLLDLPVETATARRPQAADRMEEKGNYYHERVRRGYLRIAGQEPQRVVVIDAAAGEAEQGLVIWQLVQDLFEKKMKAGNFNDR